MAGLGLVIASTLLVYRYSWKALYFLAPVAVAGPLFYRVDPEYYASFLGAMAIGCTAGITFRGKKSFQFYLVTASLAVTLVFSANYYGLKVFGGIDLFTQSKSQFAEYISRSEIPDAKKQEIASRLDSSMETLRDIVPFSYFLNGLFFSAVAFFVLRHITRRFSGAAPEETRGIEFFRLHDYFIFTVILGWLGFMLIDGVAWHAPYALALNVALIFSMLYVVQAAGIFKFFLVKRGIPLFVLPLALFLVVSVFIELIIFFLIIFASIGAIDFWADFRKLEAARNSGER